MLILLLIGLATVIVIFAVMIAMRPDVFLIKRSLAMSAPEEEIFFYINDLRQWDSWSPWARLDVNAKRSFEGPPAGVGATMRWEGDKKAGKGSALITQSRPHNLIRFLFEFEEPIQGASTAEFVLIPIGDQTAVTWSMYGTLNWMGKANSLLYNAEETTGRQLERGLLNLKSLVEADRHGY
jgi:hypothetical protein